MDELTFVSFLFPLLDCVRQLVIALSSSNVIKADPRDGVTPRCDSLVFVMA